MRAYTISARCGRCHQWFYYARENPHGRKRTTCDACRPDTVKQSNRDRQAAFRQRKREAQKQTTKRAKRKKPQPVVIGSREGTERATPKPTGRGLFADLPDPGRTAKRKAVGLP